MRGKTLTAVMNRWCPGPESNRHALRRGILSPLRLPISPPGHGGESNIMTQSCHWELGRDVWGGVSRGWMRGLMFQFVNNKLFNHLQIRNRYSKLLKSGHAKLDRIF